jgi:hypothetical protein
MDRISEPISCSSVVSSSNTDGGWITVGPTRCLALLEWGRQLVAAPPWRSIRHVCGNMCFVADEANAAEGTSVLTVYMVVGNDAATTVPFSVGEDHDRFVRTEQMEACIETLGRAVPRGEPLACTRGGQLVTNPPCPRSGGYD